MQSLKSHLAKLGLVQMPSQTVTPGIVRITLVDRHSYEWTLERILDAPWLPDAVQPFIKAYETLAPHNDEQSIELGDSQVLKGLVIRSARPSGADLRAYIVLWPAGSSEPTRTYEASEPLAAYDVVGRLLLLLMQGGSAGIAAATNLAQSTAAIKAARSLSARNDPDFQASGRKLASATRNAFDALLIEACVGSKST